MTFTRACYAYTSPSQTRWYHLIRKGTTGGTYVVNGYFTLVDLAKWFPAMPVVENAHPRLSAAIGAAPSDDGRTWS